MNNNTGKAHVGVNEVATIYCAHILVTLSIALSLPPNIIPLPLAFTSLTNFVLSKRYIENLLIKPLLPGL